MSCNLAFVRGVLSSAPEIRTLASGDRLATLQVTIRDDASATSSLPLAVLEPPAWIESAASGDEIVAFGSVRRRFFRAAGVTASRVEVVAEAIGRGNDRRAVQRCLRRAHAALEATLDEPR